jgi:hypothetical protein
MQAMLTLSLIGLTIVCCWWVRRARLRREADQRRVFELHQTTLEDSINAIRARFPPRRLDYEVEPERNSDPDSRD